MKILYIRKGDLAKTSKGVRLVKNSRKGTRWHNLRLRENWMKYVMKEYGNGKWDEDFYLLMDVEYDWFLYGRKGISKKTAGKYRRFWRRLGHPLIH